MSDKYLIVGEPEQVPAYDIFPQWIAPLEIGKLYLGQVQSGLLHTKTEEELTNMSELKQEKPTSPTVYSLDGPLPGGRYLASPLTVLIEYDDGEFIRSSIANVKSSAISAGTAERSIS